MPDNDKHGREKIVVAQRKTNTTKVMPKQVTTKVLPEDRDWFPRHSNRSVTEPITTTPLQEICTTSKYGSQLQQVEANPCQGYHASGGIHGTNEGHSAKEPQAVKIARKRPSQPLVM